MRVATTTCTAGAVRATGRNTAGAGAGLGLRGPAAEPEQWHQARELGQQRLGNFSRGARPTHPVVASTVYGRWRGLSRVRRWFSRRWRPPLIASPAADLLTRSHSLSSVLTRGMAGDVGASLEHR